MGKPSKIQVVTGDCPMQDNLKDLYAKFQLEYSEKYDGGSMFVCKVCGSLAHSVEAWFPCRSDYVPMRVWCNECRTRWALALTPSDEEMEGRVVH